MVVKIIGTIIIAISVKKNLGIDAIANVKPFDALIAISEINIPIKIDNIAEITLIIDISIMIIFLRCFNFIPNVLKME